MILKIALKNSRKYLRRNIIIGVAILVTIISLLLLDAINEGFMQSAFNTILKKEGMILISPKNGIDPFEYSIRTIKNYKKIEDYAQRNIPGARITGFINFPLICSNDCFSLDLLGTASNDTIFLNDYKRYIIKGTIPRSFKEAMIGNIAARLLHSDINDTLILIANDRYGGMGVAEVVISGIFHSPRREENQAYIILSANIGRTLLAWRPDEIQQMKINLPDYKKSNDYAMALQKEFTNVLVEPYNKRLQNLEELMRVGNIKISIFIIIIMIVSAGIIMNTVLTSVFERKKEIGTLRAIGMSRMETFSLIITEVLIVSLISSIAGLIISFFIANHLMTSGISLGNVSGIFEYMDNVIYPVINPLRWTGDTLFVIFFAFLSSLYPVLLISRMKPVDALRP